MDTQTIPKPSPDLNLPGKPTKKNIDTCGRAIESIIKDDSVLGEAWANMGANARFDFFSRLTSILDYFCIVIPNEAEAERQATIKPAARFCAVIYGTHSASGRTSREATKNLIWNLINEVEVWRKGATSREVPAASDMLPGGRCPTCGGAI
jgi:hypothetical protein